MRPGKKDTFLEYNDKTAHVKRRRGRVGLRMLVGAVFLLVGLFSIAILISLPGGEILGSLGLILLGVGSLILSFILTRG